MTSRTDLLVLGASGPIGTALRRTAERTGLSVVAASRSGDLSVDVGDSGAVARLLEGVAPRTIVYLVNTPGHSPEDGAAVLAATAASAARAGASRMILASSAAIYGDQSDEPYREDSPLDGSSDYARTKILSERALTGAAGETGLSTTSLRIFNVFGPGCRSSLINMLVDRPRPPLRLSAGLVRDYVHVDDVVAALLAALRNPEVTGPVNIARGVAVDNLQLAEAAGPDAYVPIEGDVHSISVADVEAARRLLGWSATVDPVAFLRNRGQLPAAATRS